MPVASISEICVTLNEFRQSLRSYKIAYCVPGLKVATGAVRGKLQVVYKNEEAGLAMQRAYIWSVSWAKKLEIDK